MITTVAMIITGIFTGIVTGLTGASGVMVVIPLITILFGFPVHAAIGTSLVADVIAAIPIAYTYHKHNHTDIKAGIWIALGAVVGAQIGAIKAVGVPGGWLAMSLAIFMILLGIKMWVKGAKHQASQKKFELPLILQTVPGHMMTMTLIGFIVGLFTGFFGAGGGILIFLVLYFILRLPLKTAIGTSTLMMIITALSGSAGYLANGNIDLKAGIIIGCAAAVGGMFSAHLANHISDDRLAKAVGAIFVVLALVMIGIKVLGINIDGALIG